MANLFVLLVNHDWERHHCPEEFPRHLVDESTQRSLVVERKGRLCLWNVATGAQIPTKCYSPSLCSKHPDVPELYRAAFMVYAALDLPQGVGDVETLMESHGKELATAVGLCVKLLEHNFKLHSQALQKVISRKKSKVERHTVVFLTAPEHTLRTGGQCSAEKDSPSKHRGHLRTGLHRLELLQPSSSVVYLHHDLPSRASSWPPSF